MIGDLAEHPRFLPLLVDAFFTEWPQWCSRVGRSTVEGIFVPSRPLPVILVAFERDELLGTIALRPWFAEERMDETPWVRQLLVLPAHRGRGVDRALIAAVAARASALGFDRLYAATNRIEPLLVRRGWEVFERVERDGEKFAWLRREIAQPAPALNA